MPEYLSDSYSKDTIRAIDAKFEAQKIAFAPLVFQAVKALLELGLLKVFSDSGEKGLTLNEAAKAADIPVYAAEVLLEIALGMNIVKVLPSEERFVLGKIGWFLLEDEMTKVNFNFVNDVCYKGAFELTQSLKTGKPVGLEVFTTEKHTIYEALATLPQQVKDSWFAFDHFYSDICFEEALPIVLSGKPKKIIDIGGNTAKWAISCCRYDPDVEVLIVDLPGQTKVAEQKAVEAGFSDRIKTLACDILDKDTSIPSGADIIWMSQFLDCFSLGEISRILAKVRAAAKPATDVYILEPFWDKQRFEAAAFSLQATSLYFTCMANGNSKMYRYGKFTNIIEQSGFEIAEARHKLGSNDYSLLRCRSKA
jgi:ubiquinone/menaquinone biosynthesis C-methylase UbiE